LTPLHQECSEKMPQAHLHLIDSRGVALNSAVQAACETAFQRVVLDYPHFDQAQIANWAEEVAAVMDERGDAIQFRRRYAYMALRGKVRDWLRTGPGRAELKGIGPDLEEVAGHSESSGDQTERKLLFERILPALNERDRAILVLLLNEQSTAAVASFLNTSYAAAAKAMQRVKDRVSIVLNGKRHRTNTESTAGELAQLEG
jgi:hypothetical protein